MYLFEVGSSGLTRLPDTQVNEQSFRGFESRTSRLVKFVMAPLGAVLG